MLLAICNKSGSIILSCQAVIGSHFLLLTFVTLTLEDCQPVFFSFLFWEGEGQLVKFNRLFR